MFEDEIKEYESIRKEYQQKIIDRMGKTLWMEYNVIRQMKSDGSLRKLHEKYGLVYAYE
jgi:hypothetical protein